MPVYEFTIRVREGESEYPNKHMIEAPDPQSAWTYAENYMIDYFGEDTENYDGAFWSKDGCRAASVRSVARVNTKIVFDIETGKSARYQLVKVEE